MHRRSLIKTEGQFTGNNGTDMEDLKEKKLRRAVFFAQCTIDIECFKRKQVLYLCKKFAFNNSFINIKEKVNLCINTKQFS